MKSRMIVGGLLLAVAVVLAGALGAVAQQTTPDKSGGTLTIALNEKLDTLDVFTSALESPLRVLGMICETLVVYDNNLQIQPLLAESWSVSSDQLTWTFQLKQGINFHDGTPFNAQSLHDYLVDYFIPKSFNGWEFDPVKSIVVAGEYTIQFVLDKPYPMLLKYLGDPWNIIESPTARAKYGDRYGFDAVVGTGSYEFVNWVRGDRIVLKRNPDYDHGPSFLTNQGPGYPDQIVFRVIPEPVTQVAELQHGDVDLLRTVPENMLAQLQKDPNITVALHPSFRVIYVSCNMDKAIMQDKSVREAINHAIDRKAVLDATFQGYGEIAYSLLPPSATAYWDGSKAFASSILTYDPAQSRKLLDEDGWVLPPGKQYREKNGQELKLDLVTFNVPRYQLPAQVVKAMLADIGIDVNLEIFDAAAANARLEAGDFDFTVTGWAYNIGEVTLDMIVGSQSIPNPNYARYNSPSIDQELQTVRLGATEQERDAAAAKIQQQIVEDQIDIPLVVRIDSMAAKTARVGGLSDLEQNPWWLDLAAALELHVKK